MSRRTATVTLILLSLWLVSARIAANPDGIELELRSFEPADGYAVNLFASEADGIVNPLAMRWDTRGRLWVACSLVYPQIEPGEIPDDKIIVLEDTDSDGRADKSIVFAGGLNIPTGIEIGAGGVYVGQGTELLHLKDTNGDGRADERRVVLSGFGNGDSHQTINSFVWSPGGELFFCQGDGIESRVETPWGISSLFQAGVFRLRPRRLELHGLLDDFMGPGNPWGVAFDDWGQAIVIDGAGGISFLTPAMLPTSHFLKLPRIGREGGYCGIDVLGGLHLPDDARGDIVIGDYHRNMVSRFSLRPDGAGFDVEWKPPLVHSTHRNFRPVDVKQGPDGAIYIADWYNPIICHQDDSYRHPDRDRTHGRIWRVTARGRALATKPRLVGVPLGRVLEHLKSPERWTRHQAKRELSNRAVTEADRSRVARALKRWVAALDGEAPGYERHLFESLGVFESLEVVEPELLGRLLTARDHRARAYATRVIGRWQERLDDPLGLVAARITEPHPLVRMEAVIASAQVRAPRAVEIATRVVDRPTDAFIEYALIQAVHMLKPHWLPAFKQGEVTFDGNVRRLAAALKTIRSLDVVKTLRRLAVARELDSQTRAAILSGMVEIGGPKELRLAFDRDTYLHDSRYDVALHSDVLGELARVHRRRQVRPDGDLVKPLQRMLEHEDARLRAEAMRLVGVWKIVALKREVLRTARSEQCALSTRRMAVASLAQLDGADSRRALEEIAARAAPRSLRIAAIAALSQADLATAAVQAAKLFSESNESDFDPTVVIRAFLARQGGADALAAVLDEIDLTPALAELGLQALSSAGRSDEQLMTVFSNALEIVRTGAVTSYSPELVKKIGSEALAKGDARHGEVVFRSRAANCHACHTVGGDGGWAGPDLSAVGTTLPLDRLVEEALWPRRHVKEGYSLVQVITQDGEVYQGYEQKGRQRKRDDTLLLRELNSGDVLQIPRARIASRIDAGTAMPSGLAASLPRTDLRDLLRFLSELGTRGAR